MNYTELFYWLTVADNAKTFFGTFAVLFTGIFIITQLVRIFTDNKSYNSNYVKDFYDKCNKWTWFSTPFMLLFLTLWIFTPNKKDALLIVAGGTTLNYLSTDSVAKQIPRELSTFVLTELKNMASDAEVDLNISSEKDRIIKTAKSLSGEELIDYLKDNPEYRKLILNDK